MPSRGVAQRCSLPLRVLPYCGFTVSAGAKPRAQGVCTAPLDESAASLLPLAWHCTAQTAWQTERQCLASTHILILLRKGFPMQPRCTLPRLMYAGAGSLNDHAGAVAAAAP